MAETDEEHCQIFIIEVNQFLNKDKICT